MAGVTEKRGTYSPGGGADGAEASWQASQASSGWQFDVFLSFRGADTRKGFTGHLYDSLIASGIRTFIDNEELEKGEKVEELFRYIERSNISVPIFSKGYADSKWCLREITKIVECGRLIIPVFYGVEPSDIRRQKGPFEQAFEKHEQRGEQEVSKWKEALQVVGGISGFNLKDYNDHEADLAKRILERIKNVVKPWRLDVADYPLGLDSRVDVVIKRLGAEIGMVLICGMGGIGKTTLAKAVYNTLYSSFEACSFLANVREVSKQHNGIAALQKQLLKDVFRDGREINGVDQGIDMIKERIGSKKVLLVIDDIDHNDQLYNLTGSRSGGFGGESRIIITSRDEKVLNVSERNIYRLPAFDPVQSLQLFSRHAFGQSEPPSDWRGEFSKKVVQIAGGIPLCLKVFGPLFSNLQSSKEWELMLEKLRNDQHKEVHERLKISYDSLDEKAQCVFLDIACFLLGNWESWEEPYLTDTQRWEQRKEKKEYVMLMWEGSKLHPTVAVEELQRKYLISINDKYGTFEMHDQIRDMGRNIVRQQKPAPSRFWENNETLKMLQRKQGLENIEGIIVHPYDEQYLAPLNTMSFGNMAELRILHTSFVRLEGSYHHLPNSLTFLRWWRCPLKSLGVDFPVHNIVVLDLTESNIKQFLSPSWTNWRPFGYFQTPEANHFGKFSQLKVLILKRCRNLKSTPDFRLIPNATKLIFEGCTNLSQVHESIGDLQSLVSLNLKDCSSLKKIPDTICRLTSLEILNLDHCNNISTLPQKLGELQSLKKLNLQSCWSLRELPEQIGGLESLRELQLCQYDMPSIPDSIGELTNLQELEIFLCKHLKSIPDISKLQALRRLSLTHCWELMDVHGLTKLRCLEYLNLSGCDALTGMKDMMKEAKFEHYKEIWLPGRPSTFSRFESTGGVWTWSVTLSFHLPNVPLPGRIFIHIEGRLPESWTVTEVKAVRHDDSFIIFERAEREGPTTEPMIVILDGGAGSAFYIPPKEEDEKEKAGMIRDGTPYRRIDVTFQALSDFSGCRFYVSLDRLHF